MNALANQRVRRVQVSKDQIVTVRTAIGIATIIQVQDRPNSVVVGDQDSFKVEYLDQAITIKPLSSGAKSNLYVYTDWRRYNVKLVAGSEAAADYVVYLDNPVEKQIKTPVDSSQVKWTKFVNHLQNGNIKLEVIRLGRAKDGVLLVEFLINSKTKESFRPEWLWLTQNGITRPIHNLFLSNLEVKQSVPVKGIFQLNKNDLDLDASMKLELRRSKNSYLTLKKVNAWN